MPSPSIPLTCIKVPEPRISMDTNILAIAIATAFGGRARKVQEAGPLTALLWWWVVSSFVFVLAILLLLLYQRDPQCCQFLCSCCFFQGPSQCDCPPPYFSNNQDLVGPLARPQPSERMRTRVQEHFQGDEIFCVGLPSNYQLPPWHPPRLPSYESVRKKDRQQQIHRLIAHRFGLWTCREVVLDTDGEHLRLNYITGAEEDGFYSVERTTSQKRLLQRALRGYLLRQWLKPNLLLQRAKTLPPTYEESLGPLPEVPPSPGSAHPFQRTTAFPTQRNTAV